MRCLGKYQLLTTLAENWMNRDRICMRLEKTDQKSSPEYNSCLLIIHQERAGRSETMCMSFYLGCCQEVIFSSIFLFIFPLILFMHMSCPSFLFMNPSWSSLLLLSLSLYRTTHNNVSLRWMSGSLYFIFLTCLCCKDQKFVTCVQRRKQSWDSEVVSLFKNFLFSFSVKMLHFLLSFFTSFKKVLLEKIHTSLFLLWICLQIKIVYACIITNMGN